MMVLVLQLLLYRLFPLASPAPPASPERDILLVSSSCHYPACSCVKNLESWNALRET